MRIVFPKLLLEAGKFYFFVKNRFVIVISSVILKSKEQTEVVATKTIAMILLPL